MNNSKTRDGGRTKEYSLIIKGSAIALLAFSICLACALTVGADRSQAATAESTVKNVVLVHGAARMDQAGPKLFLYLRPRVYM